jgi:AsmA protein
LYQGEYKGDVMLDVRQDTPKISADERLSMVHIGPLLKDVLGEDKVSGTANLAAKVTAAGVTPEAITKTLNGSASFSFKDGAVKGVNIGQLIREAYAKIKNKPKPPKTTNQTDFAAVSGSATIRNGIVNNQDLRASSPALRVAGKGTVDLPKQRINYLLNTSIVETDQGQGGKELAELKSVTIPVKISGTFEKPKFSLDLGPVLKAKAEAKIKKEKKKLKKEVKEKVEEKKAEAKKKLEEKLKDKLKGLFR